MKTVPSKRSVADFIDQIDDSRRKAEATTLLRIMKRATHERPVIWGDSIVGFGSYSYERANGKEYEMFRTGFSPRKQALTVYVMPGYTELGELLDVLGPHKLGKCCLYLKRLSDVDTGVLENLIEAAHAAMNRKYPR